MVRLTNLIGDDPRFLELTSKLDDLLASRFGAYAAAEKCRDRAMVFYDNGKIIQAIDHLHRVKISWFSAEALRGTIIASRFIAQCYDELGMKYAAKYYLLSSSHLAFNSKDEDVSHQISKCLFEAAEVIYGAGDWFSYFSVMRLALYTHHSFDNNPLDLVEHESLQSAIYYAVIIRTLSKRFWPEAYEHVEECFGELLLDDETRAGLKKLTDELPNDAYWVSAPFEEIWQQIEGCLAGKPFSDTGSRRTISWKALGIKWNVSFENSYELTRVVEEFVAVLQISLVDLAQDDFQLLPVNIEINAFLSKGGNFDVKEKPNNDKLVWDVFIPVFKLKKQSAMMKRTSKVFAYAVSVLGYCTTLNYEDLQSKLKAAMKKGLSSKTFYGRPYPELYGEVITEDIFNEELRKKMSVVDADREFNYSEHDQLSWVNTSGANYSDEEAEKHAKNRYERLSGMMEILWPKVMASEVHREYVKGLHGSGYLDWHISSIVCNTVADCIVQMKVTIEPSNENIDKVMYKIMNSVFDGEMDQEIQHMDLESIPIDNFVGQEKVSFLSIMKTWKLEPASTTPNFEAIKQFLGARYKIFEIDAPHNPLFLE